MSDLRFDAVVLGGGHHATIIARYLARAGMTVGVFERAPHLGGGANTSEGPAPGFLMNHCSHWTRFYAHPAYRDFDLVRGGAALRLPRGQRRDGVRRRLVVRRLLRPTAWSTPRRAAPSARRRASSARYEQIRRFSTRDAETYLRLLDQFERYWRPAFKSPPLLRAAAVGRARPARAAARDPGRRDRARAPVHELRQLAYDFFESRRAAHAVHACGVDVDGLLPRRLPGPPGPRPQPSARALLRARGDRRRRQPGDHRRAGLRRARSSGSSTSRSPRSPPSGSRATARRGIVLGRRDQRRRRHRRQRPRDPADGAAPARRPRDRRAPRHRIKNIHYDRGQLMWANVALHEPPRYSPRRHEPGGRAAAAAVLGAEGPRLLRDCATSPRSTCAGTPSGSFVLTSVRHVWDPARAPEGKHIIGVEEFAAPTRLFDKAQEWVATSSSASPGSCSTSGAATRRT